MIFTHIWNPVVLNTTQNGSPKGTPSNGVILGPVTFSGTNKVAVSSGAERVHVLCGSLCVRKILYPLPRRYWQMGLLRLGPGIGVVWEPVEEKLVHQVRLLFVSSINYQSRVSSDYNAITGYTMWASCLMLYASILYAMAIPLSI